MAAANAGLDIVAVTDHNSADWIDRIRNAARSKPIAVFPGVEITTPEGHVLALFDRDHSSSEIADLLVTIGIPRSEHGKETAISTAHVEDVLNAISHNKGIAIAAHANSSSGLLEGKGQWKMRTIPRSDLAALEFTKESDVAKFTTGSVPGYPAKACVHSSDAHSLLEMGRFASYYKMDEPNLRGLRQALLDYRVKIRFPWDYKTSAHPRIVSLEVDQGFFGGVRFEFHGGLNCVVGGKGTGKSTVIELLRYAFDDVSQFDLIRDDHVSKVEKLVGDGGCITVEYLDSDGVTKSVRREVQPWATTREIRDANGNESALETAPAFFSQGELVLVASSTVAQLDLLDRTLDLVSETRREAKAISNLKVNASQLIAERQKLEQLESEINHPERGQGPTEQRHRHYSEVLKEEVLREFPKWEAEQKHLSELRESIETFRAEALTALETIDGNALRVPAPDSPNRKKLESLGDLSDPANTGVTEAKQAITRAMDSALKKVDDVAAELKPGFITQKNKHDDALRLMGEDSVRKANAQFRNLQNRLETLRKQQAELAKVEGKIASLVSARENIHEDLKGARRSRWNKRNEKAAAYQGKLSGLLHVDVTYLGDRQAYAIALKELCKGARASDPAITLVSEKVAPSALVRLVEKGDGNGLATAAGISEDVASRMISYAESKGYSELLDLEIVDLPDKPSIRYQVDRSTQRQLNALSTGQKGTVIISLAMIEGWNPLVIDHPEEPLDTQSIYGQVVQKLRETKEARQFVFTTHNANVAVGADAELNHILEATAEKGKIVASGGIADNATNRLLLIHLEGGQEALDLRVRKYSS